MTMTTMIKMMLKLNQVLLCSIIIISCATFNVNGITIDNQLISAKNDCFDRIAIGAMLPFEKTFRTEDTNSLSVCEELCAREGELCQTYSLGIHSKGNGTCQLSSEVIDSSRARPIGTIFDPDFDLYARRNNCIVDQPSTPDIYGLSSTDRDSTFSRPSPTYPSSPSTTTIVDRPTTTIFIQDTPTTTNRDPTTNGNNSPRPTYSVRPSSLPPTQSTIGVIQSVQPLSTIPPTNRYPDRLPGDKYGPWDNQPNGYGGDDRYPAKDRYPEKYPDKMRPSGRPYDENFPLHDRPQPYPVYDDRDRVPNGNNFYDSRPGYDDRGPTYDDRNKFPNYDFPMLYEKNYPLSNDKDKERPPYGQNPSGDNDYYRPSFNGNYDQNRPSSDNGYGTRPTQSFPQSNGQGNGYDNLSKPGLSSPQGNGYDQRPTRPIPTQNRPDPDRPDATASQRPGSTDPAYSGPTSSTFSTSNPTSSNSYPGKPTSGTNYHVTEEPIEIYFNPDSYYPTKPNKAGDEGEGSYGGPKPGDACFRRVLAGKRVAPHWIRRTLSCERVDDCQRECGEEKRFTCEGFNYRLDPSGHGQGICELIEIPLSQMDVYSSPHSRDSNLLRHPDYDYYERDRNARPGCHQPIGCVDCNYLKPYRPIYRPSSADRYQPYPDQQPDYEHDRFRPSSTALDKYRPPVYDNRPPSGYNSYNFHVSQYYSDNKFGGHNKPQYGPELDRFDPYRPLSDNYRPGYGEIQVPTLHNQRPIEHNQFPRPGIGIPLTENYRPDYKQHDYDYRPQYNYLDRDPPGVQQQRPYVPYMIGGQDNSWGVYGGNYGYNTNQYNRGSAQDYWGIKNELKRHDPPSRFNYNDLGGDRYGDRFGYGQNSVWNYSGNRYGADDRFRPDSRPNERPDGRPDYGSLWTRRPGLDECSVKSSEGFRLQKDAVRNAYNAPNIRDCEQMCANENKFRCHTYSYKYSNSQDNCLLCDRPYSLLDYYADLEQDRNYDIYSMADDSKVCRDPPKPNRNNAQCFFRAVDGNRFFKSIVRDSLTCRSVGECELECIKSTKFACRAFSFRYGSPSPGSIIDNCQLSDWPVRDMDKERHLVHDPTFDVFERANYGHGCEIQPIVDVKHNKLCYLGYGSPAKLLSSSIKKVISVPTELDCKNECSRYRDNSVFKCFSFSFGAHASTTFNCEMSDLDQSQLKLNIDYAHTNDDRDYWLFAWNPFDWTCRDRVTTISGNRVNNDRRMDIFRDPGDATWSHFTVSGKPCRVGTKCEKNLITGFYSCEIEGGEISAWDYCCKDEHPCGYSKGFEYPWCMVGDKKDQWRQCSDRYFPSKKGPNTITTKNPSDRKKGDIYQHPPRPGGLLEDFAAARLWPVTFLYTDGPPNSTELSNAIDCKKETC